MAGKGRVLRRRVSGVLLLDKPGGMSSNGALQAARRLFAADKAGHTGTLDPMASGLLVVAFGEASKFSQSLLDADKSYRATARLGQKTTTGDAEGELVAQRECAADASMVEAAMARFRGEIAQVPPMYSALKRGGRPLYELARQGLEVAREARAVTIHELRLRAMSGRDIEFDVHCSKGTYVRTLAEDIGEALGCGAHLVALRRTAIGDLRLADAVSLDALEAAGAAARDQLLLPVDRLVADLPMLRLAPPEAEVLAHGGWVPRAGEAGRLARLYGPAGFIGVGRFDGEQRLWPKRMLADPSQRAACGAH